MCWKQQLPIKEVVSGGGGGQQWTFAQFRHRLTQLLLAALQVENDSFNTHLLLGGLANLIHDLAAFEQVPQPATVSEFSAAMN